MNKDLILTFFSESIVLVSGLLVYKLAAGFADGDAFPQYALCRRTVSFLFPALIMGLSVGIPRYIAYSSSTISKKHPDKYFIAGISVLLANVLLLIMLLTLFKSAFAFLFFGSKEYDFMVFPISLMVLGLTLHTCCYSYYRGKLLMVRANMLQIVNSGIIPVAVFFSQADIIHILSLTGFIWSLSSCVVLILILKDLQWITRESFLPYFKELLSYGIQRVPGDFGLAALFSLPAIITAHISGITEAGYVAFGMIILKMTGALYAPIGLVLLPKASQLIANMDIDKLKRHVSMLAGLTILSSVTGGILFQLFAEDIMAVYLGKTLLEILGISRIIMVGCVAYTFYVAMRSLIDAYYFKAVNSLNIIVALTLFVIASGVVYMMKASHLVLIGSFVCSIYVLGILTFISTVNLMGCQRKARTPS